jgi:hypothetical protein
MSWNLFNKPPLTFEMGKQDAKRQMNDLLERGYSEKDAIDKLSDLYKKYRDPKSPTAFWLPYGKGQDKYLEGYRAFLESVIQARFSVPEQIHPETNVNLACDLLEFLNGDGVTTPPSPTAVCTQPDMGYAVAETVYFNLIGRGLDIEEIYAHFEQNKLSLTQGLSVNDRAGFQAFRDAVIEPRLMLEKAFNLS